MSIELRKCPYTQPIKNVKFGTIGNDVKWVQWYLVANGYNIAIDGIFGTNSVQALKSFQERSKLEVDGICGKNTRVALLKTLNAATKIVEDTSCPYVEPNRNIKYNDIGEDVKWLQWYLNKHGSQLEVDGEFGGKTLTALKSFQRSAGVEVDGICGIKTRQALKCAHTNKTNTEANELIKQRDAIVAYCNAQVGSLYVYGAQGQTTASTIDWSARCFPNYTTSTRANRMKKYLTEHPQLANGQQTKMFDCSGLIWAAIAYTGFDVVEGKKITDSTAASLYNDYCVHISKAELQEGDLVFTTNLDHVAIIGKNGVVVECAGSDIGCVLNKDVNTRTVKSIYGAKYGCNEYYTKSPWTKFGRFKRFYDANI